MFEDHPSIATQLTFEQIQHYILAANTMASRVAVDAGLDYSVCLRLHDDYIEKISHSKNPNQLPQVFRDMITDYATKVQKIHALPSSHPIVKKIAEAKLLLSQTSLPVSEISAMLNFTNPSYFCHLFKKVTGQTPKEFAREV